MSGEIKILLYVIGTIVYYFVKSYNKEKKKQDEKHVNKRPSTTKSAEDIFEELKRTLTLDTKTVMSIPLEPKKVERKEMPKKSDNYNDYFATRAKKAITNHVAIENKEIEIAKKEVAMENEVNVINLDTIDYKQAIIFSEILKRPQY